MKTTRLSGIHSSYRTAPVEEIFKTRVFVIGVKGMGGHCLDYLLEKYPNLQAERLPEVVNPNYMLAETASQHILQPAFVIWKA